MSPVVHIQIITADVTNIIDSNRTHDRSARQRDGRFASDENSQNLKGSGEWREETKQKPVPRKTERASVCLCALCILRTRPRSQDKPFTRHLVQDKSDDACQTVVEEEQEHRLVVTSPHHLENPALARVRHSSQLYSARSASITSTRAARAAGSVEATIAAASSTKAETTTGKTPGICISRTYLPIKRAAT